MSQFPNVPFQGLAEPPNELLCLRQIVQNTGGFDGEGIPIAIPSPSPGFEIPGTYDEQDFTYVSGGVANNDLIATQTFKLKGATVGVLTYTYVGSTNNIQSIIRTT